MKKLLLLLLLLPHFTTAQTPDTLTHYLPFFKKQAIEYQKWLSASGMGKVLKVQDVDIRANETDTTVILYLAFYTENADTALALWRNLKQDFRKLGTVDSLEKALFDRMVFLFAIPPDKGEIRVFETYNLSKKPLFARQIKLKNNQLLTNAREHRGPEEDRKIKVSKNQLSVNGKPVSSAVFQKAFSQEAVFDKLKPFFQQHYTTSRCDNRYPTLRFFQRDDSELHFEVRDLCREILKDEENPWWCRVLYSVGYLGEKDKNCIKRERIEVHITYIPDPKGESFVLHTKIEASYGSGWYDKPRDNGYHDLKTDYPQYLSTYADELNEKIRLFLLRP